MLLYYHVDLILVGYTDFDFQSNRDSRKSIFGMFSLWEEELVGEV